MIRSMTIFFAGCVLAVATAHAGGAASAVSVSDAYARAVPPGQPNSAVFMNLANPGEGDHALVAVESSASRVAELHSHSEEDGMMKMRRLDQIELPAGSSVSLRPGGGHIMLIGLSRQLEPGQQVDLTLIFEDGTRKRFEAPVRSVEIGEMGHAAH